MEGQFPKGALGDPHESKQSFSGVGAIGGSKALFERKSLKWPILVAILMIVMLVGLTVGWVLLNVFSALDAEKPSRSAIYWVLLSVGAVFFAFLLAGVVLYLI